MKNKPWIENTDPFKERYGLLDNNELMNFLNLFYEWNKDESILGTDIHKVKTGIQLLDFFDYNNETTNITLFENLCLIMGGENEILYWIPLCNNEDITFQNFSPPMIAKTSIEKEALENASRSFMQMLNGGYIFFDSNCRFIGIVIDGYYMYVFMKKEFMSDVFTQYINNWDKVDEFLDPVLKDDLMSRRPIHS